MQAIQLVWRCGEGEPETEFLAGKELRSREINQEPCQLLVSKARSEPCPRVLDLRHNPLHRLSVDPALLIKVSVLEYAWEDFFRYADQYPTAVKAVLQLDPTGSDPLAISGVTFLESAKRAGADVSDEAVERFTKGSKLAGALSVRKKRR